MDNPIVRTDPAMYMLWPEDRSTPDAHPIPAGYNLSTIPSENMDRVRPLVEKDGTLTDAAWHQFLSSVVPDGMFVVREQTSLSWVGTISAVHNPAATRFYFPGGGELGYLFVAPEHRRKGLGFALIVAAVRRLHQGGYRNIFLGVQGWRLPAIQAYLRAGFRPFIHAQELLPRWQSVFAAMGWETHEAEWPTCLAATRNRSFNL